MERTVQNSALTIDRRGFLDFSATGLAAASLFGLMNRARAAESSTERSHPVARARRAIHICLIGGLSQVDSFDYKPALERLHGKPFPGQEKPTVFNGGVGMMRKSEWAFHRRGESGLWVSDLFPHLAGVADEDRESRPSE